MFEYKAVPFTASVNSGDKKAANAAATQLTADIATSVVDGWDFYALGSISVAVNPGCLAGLFGAKATMVSLDQLIFRRPKS